MSVRIVADLPALEALAPAWADLWAQDAGATPFQHPACQLAWARSHASDRTFAAVQEGPDGLAAVAAAFTWEGAALLAGTGPTDYGAAVLGPGADVPGLLAALAGEGARRGAAALDLRQLRPGDPLSDLPAPPGWRERREPDEVCPVSPLAGADGLAAMTASAAKKLAYTRRKAERAGGWTVELATGETAPGHIERLFAFHHARWAAAGEPGVLDDPLLRAFLREAAPALVAAGVGRLRTLSLAGEPAAVLLALEGADAVHMYLTGFDPAFTALGPGTLLIAETLSAAAAAGCTQACWLRGREPYKYGWGAEDRPTWRRVLTPG